MVRSYRENLVPYFLMLIILLLELFFILYFLLSITFILVILDFFLLLQLFNNDFFIKINLLKIFNFINFVKFYFINFKLNKKKQHLTTISLVAYTFNFRLINFNDNMNLHAITYSLSINE